MQREIIATVLVVVLLAGAVLVYQTLSDNDDSEDFSAALISADSVNLPTIGFATVDGPYEWRFPDDYNPHADFQREQWLLESDSTCNVTLSVAFERVSLLSEGFFERGDSNWRVSQTMTALAQVTANGDTVIDDQRVQRVAIDLAGADAERVWVEDWSLDFAGAALALQSYDAAVVAQLSLEAGQPQNTQVSWYSYTRRGRMMGTVRADRDVEFACDVILTHRFGT